MTVIPPLQRNRSAATALIGTFTQTLTSTTPLLDRSMSGIRGLPTSRGSTGQRQWVVILSEILWAPSPRLPCRKPLMQHCMDRTG